MPNLVKVDVVKLIDFPSFEALQGGIEFFLDDQKFWTNFLRYALFPNKVMLI